MKPGDPVEVRWCWAGGYRDRHYTWSSGYELVELTATHARVRGTRPSDELTFGQEVLYSRNDVRPLTERWEVRGREGLEGVFPSEETAKAYANYLHLEFGERFTVRPES